MCTGAADRAGADPLGREEAAAATVAARVNAAARGAAAAAARLGRPGCGGSVAWPDAVAVLVHVQRLLMGLCCGRGQVDYLILIIEVRVCCAHKPRHICKTDNLNICAYSLKPW